ncbi:MAG: ADP-ribosylglycohydrolase family protein [Actinomycetota bacterium]
MARPPHTRDSRPRPRAGGHTRRVGRPSEQRHLGVHPTCPRPDGRGSAPAGDRVGRAQPGGRVVDRRPAPDRAVRHDLPGRPDEARARAARFARVTNSGLAVDVSAFYAHLYAEAFFESDLDWLLDRALADEPVDSEVTEIVEQVRAWHANAPDDWRWTRARIAETYDTDPDWWASRVNFATTIMALLYGDGDLVTTLHIAGLAGWDADNNMTSAAGLLGIIDGFEGLPATFRSSSDVYFNQDLTGPLPMFDSVTGIADRTVRQGESVLFSIGARRIDDGYQIPLPD